MNFSQDLILKIKEKNFKKENVLRIDSICKRDDELKCFLFSNNIKEAIKILKDSNDLLKIEDILPLFPDFTTIDDFKKEICEALEEYNLKIDGLKEEIEDYNLGREEGLQWEDLD